MVTPLDRNVILSLVNDKNIDITVLKTTESTNNAFEERAPSTTLAVCLAEIQTQGRGQLQRVWHSPFAENIYLSLCYFSSQPLDALAPLSLVVGFTLCKLLNSHFSLKHPVQIKWPNDIVCKNAKLAGILIETKKISERSHRVVIGVGVNVNMQSTPNHAISQPWTSLLHLTSQSYDRNPICALLINEIQTVIETFEANGFVFFAPQWQQYNALLNNTITVRHDQTHITGKCLGISPQGALMLELADGSIRKFLSGEAYLQ